MKFFDPDEKFTLMKFFDSDENFQSNEIGLKVIFFLQLPQPSKQKNPSVGRVFPCVLVILLQLILKLPHCLTGDGC